MVAFGLSWLVLFAGIGIVFVVAGRRPPGSPLLWGEAMVGGTFAFFLMFWAYGVLAHQWLTLADNEWAWRPDRTLYGPWDILKPQTDGGALPVIISYRTLRDIIAVLLYVVLLGGQMALWSIWQGRADKKVADVELSDYGRPLVQAKGSR